MAFRTKIVVYNKDRMEHINTMYGQMESSLIFHQIVVTVTDH
jgi:hypothetical protein